MYDDLLKTRLRISKQSSQESAEYFAGIASRSRNELVKVDWSVTYDPMGHDILSTADVSILNASDAILQVWLRNAATGIWIPEAQPWEVSVVEFKHEQLISHVRLGLFDSKWTSDDIGRKYHYELWGYLHHEGQVELFAYEKWATYPGDA